MEFNFHQAVIEIKNRLDILSIIGKYINVVKKGNSYLAVCPFHADKNPSLNINSQKNIFKCFACGAYGDAFKFIMDYKKISFKDAVYELASIYNIKIRESSSEETEAFKKFYEIYDCASKFYKKNLYEKIGETALSYLKNKRGLLEKTLQDFELGYAPSNKIALFNYLKENNYSEEFIKESGLCIEDLYGNNNLVDRFRERIIIPIKDLQSRVIAFGGRTLQDDVTPKYLNSAESPIYKKGENLFAIDIARINARNEQKVLLLEGYFDVIQAHQSGINYAVATLGTALTETQANLLYSTNLKRNIILCFDNDNAGMKAFERSLRIFQNLKISQRPELKALDLDEENIKDIDEYIIKKGIEKLKEKIEKTPCAFEFLINKEAKELDLITDNNLRIQKLEKITELIATIKDSLYREVLAEVCARKFNFTKTSVLEKIKAYIDNTQNTILNKNIILNKDFIFKSKRIKAKIPIKSPDSIEKFLLSLLFLDVENEEEQKIIETIKNTEFNDSYLSHLKNKLLKASKEERMNILKYEDEFSEILNSFQDADIKIEDLLETKKAFKSLRKIKSFF